LLPGAVVEGLSPVAWMVFIADGAVELAHREVDAPAVNLIVKMPCAVDISLRDVTAEFVMDNKGRDPALSGGRVIEPPVAAGLNGP